VCVDKALNAISGNGILASIGAMVTGHNRCPFNKII